MPLQPAAYPLGWTRADRTRDDRPDLDDQHILSFAFTAFIGAVAFHEWPGPRRPSGNGGVPCSAARGPLHVLPGQSLTQGRKPDGGPGKDVMTSSRRKGAVVLAGYYGFDNAGDELIL